MSHWAELTLFTNNLNRIWSPFTLNTRQYADELIEMGFTGLQHSAGYIAPVYMYCMCAHICVFSLRHILYGVVVFLTESAYIAQHQWLQFLTGLAPPHPHPLTCAHMHRGTHGHKGSMCTILVRSGPTGSLTFNILFLH